MKSQGKNLIWSCYMDWSLALFFKLCREPIFIAYLLVYLSSVAQFLEVFYLNKDLFHNWGNLEIKTPFAKGMRTLSVLFIALLVLRRSGKVFKTPILMLYFMSLILLLVSNFIVSWNFDAALMAIQKDFVPILLILLGFAYKDRLYVFVYSIIFFAVLNNIAQLVITYPFQEFGIFTGREIIYGSNIYRAAGITDTGVFEFLNFSAIICVAYLFPKIKQKNKVYFFALFGLWAMMMKSTLIFLFFALRQFLVKINFTAIFILLLLVILLGEKFIDVVGVRLNIIEFGDSERMNSYKALLESALDFNLFGEGLGSFGGPAASHYGAPLHLKFIENSQLVTTDTYFPHLFIEHGMIGGLVFLSMIFSPLFVYKFQGPQRIMYFILVIFFLYISITSFVFEDLSRAIYILPLLFPVVYNSAKKNLNL